jgi:hypothetical protein
VRSSSYLCGGRWMRQAMEVQAGHDSVNIWGQKDNDDGDDEEETACKVAVVW